ncbi:glycosyltransferase family 1 protein [Treponema sp.]|uniref:glycosyltransferase family 4 protein n=1 Tax=Treponema sp. TaxID=166 RepID=UPI00298E87E3|nr:glycosyltransferase family 1 protein [Treponema sp.]MCR5612534.1 glycosyltransferase family 4 protein [Treponema sp.]
MKIAIHIPDVNPEAGGASSLLNTIQKEIIDSGDKDNDYVILYNGGVASPLLINKDGFEYLNLDYYSKLSIISRIKNKIKRSLNIKVVLPSIFDIAAKENDIDLFWFTSPGVYDVSYPYVYTVWDLGHRRTPYFPEVSRTGWTWGAREETYQRMLYKASYILTGNEEGKKEILESYPMPEDKIRISPFPVASFCRGSEKKPDFDIPEQFFFYPAQFWPHKNHICILDALVILRDKYNLRPVVFLTGSDKGNREYIKAKIAEYKLDNQVRFTGFVTDEELKYLYSHATGMIFASLMGPNNMPPIEATFLNCPVIITDLDGHKEQLKDTALYFNGYKPDQLAAHMKTLLTSKAKRTAIIKKEIVLAKDFDKINYFACVKNIIDEFSAVRHTWGVDYIN